MALGPKIGWIGTGVMGNAMCKHVLKAGHNLSVFNRTASKADNLVALGATYKPIPQMVQDVDVMVMMLGYPHDVEKMALCPENGILQKMKPGSYLIDHTTSTPELAERIAAKAAEYGINSVDAPVSGGDIGAKNGCLIVMTGGKEEDNDAIRPVLNSYSMQVEFMGGPGKGQHTKAANQIMLAGQYVSVAESLVYGHKAGLDLLQMIELLDKGGAQSFTLGKLAPRSLKRDFAPGFYVEHFIKDLGIVLAESRRMNISLPSTALAQQLYQAMSAQGGSRMGVQALIWSLEKINNTNIPAVEKML